jgi:hypothetical protein
MTAMTELAAGICVAIEMLANPAPLTLINQTPDEAAAIIGAVVERCALNGVPLAAIWMDPTLALELGLSDGVGLLHGGTPMVRLEPNLGRQLRFEKVELAGPA